ncbi:sulfate ABC transporter permease subunit CysW [Patulibacter sp.]|uniref:sulfate ABC transporter permease subunit CysW n=1 Tax=Patulibacter sp. TaxID=1912859 RepID=UPI00271F0B97|nr:sulfate ABC transporter permease subunit CysW [Patulibacter sp.]MDO9410409.1 sulfate ABC transporter permease subunit CysW [Patulibacter sp.]
MKVDRGPRIALRTVALVYLGLLLVLPVGLILYRTFEDGIGAFWDQISTPASISAISLTLEIVAIVVPLNVVFGVFVALALVRGRFRGRGIVQAIVDLPFAVSPVIVGVSLILLWGTDGWFGGVADAGFQIIFSLPGMVLATIFVTLPFVVREVEPVLHEIGNEQEQAASTLGADRWQTFWRITLPSIRWGLAYGIVLTIARALGEFGAVSVVSAGASGESETLTLLVANRFEDLNLPGSYAAATVLMGFALVALILMSLFEYRSKRA